MKSFLKSAVVSILTFEAKLLLKRAKPRIIAVTGSVGKTSTKDAIFHVIRKKVPTRKSEKSYNSEIGVPLSILGLANAWQNPFSWLKNIVDGMILALFPGNYPEVLVLEAGVDRPGDMKSLTEWLKPDVVVLTCLPSVPVHVEHFSSPEEVVREKLILVESLKADGVLIYNHDDEKARQAAKSIPQKSIGYARYSPSDFTAEADGVVYANSTPVGTRFFITHKDQRAEFTINGTVGAQSTEHFAAAAAVASVFDISLDECAEGAGTFTPPPGRMRLIPGIKDTMIIDDTYNSSPIALESALVTLSELRGFSRKVAVLGDMLELGRHSVSAHEAAGNQAAKTADILITVGIRARGIAEAALNSGMSEKNILQYEDSVTAGRELQNLIQPGDVILIKGSQGIRMERAVADIMAQPELAEEQLVRQSAVWQSIS